MEKLKFKTKIDASREKVWEILWGDETYPEWTKPFSEGSHAKSDWEEGSKILFLDSNGHGMYSVIAKKTPNEFISFKHLGSIRDGEEIPFSGKEAEWSESEEIYSLTETDGMTVVMAEVDSVEEFKDFMMEKFPLALATVKELCEKGP